MRSCYASEEVILVFYPHPHTPSRPHFTLTLTAKVGGCTADRFSGRFNFIQHLGVNGMRFRLDLGTVSPLSLRAGMTPAITAAAAAVHVFRLGCSRKRSGSHRVVGCTTTRRVEEMGQLTLQVSLQEGQSVMGELLVRNAGAKMGSDLNNTLEVK